MTHVNDGKGIRLITTEKGDWGTTCGFNPAAVSAGKEELVIHPFSCTLKLPEKKGVECNVQGPRCPSCSSDLSVE